MMCSSFGSNNVLSLVLIRTGVSQSPIAIYIHPISGVPDVIDSGETEPT